MACFFAYFLILFLHSLENVDFIRIVVFLQENNVFHGSEGSNITDCSLFVEAFFRQGLPDRLIDFGSHLGSFVRPLGIVFFVVVIFKH